ncbi:MAG TPA: hypothetical protein VLW54_14800 [Candidatus Acidoferrales bacterium]|nr:hypothetical protein [Candidatus Acidoferrales bacterium]
MLGHRQLSAAEYLGVWQRRWKWALLPLLFGAAAGYLLSRLVPATYTSTASLEEDSRVVGKVPGVDPSYSRLAALRRQALTPERLAALASRYGIAVEQVSRDTTLSPTAVGFALSVNAANPQTARQICAEIIPWLQQEDQKLLQHLTDQAVSGVVTSSPGPTRVFSDSQMADARADREQASSRLSEFRRMHSPELLDARQHLSERKLAEAQSQLDAVNADLKNALQQRSSLTEALLAQKPGTAELRRPAEPAATQALEDQLAAQQAQLVTLQARYTEDYPDVVKAKANIAQLQRKIAEAKKGTGDAGTSRATAGAPASAPSAKSQQQISALDAKIQEKTREQAQLQQDILAARTRADAAAIAAQQFDDLNARAESSQQIYSSMLLQQSQTRGTDSSWPPQAALPRLAAAPSLPERPSYPDPAMFTLWGAGAGMALGLLGIVAGEMNDKSLRTEGDVEHFLELPTLAVIPAAGGGRTHGESGPPGGPTGHRGRKEEGVLADV